MAMTAQPHVTGRYAALAETRFDLLVIGGGIIGCGIARDAALRGLRVALFEKDDFGGGASSRSTRLIHGGLRYLEHLDFGLVRQDLRERERLLATAPHRVTPLRFLVPLYNRTAFYRARLRAGMILYDLLSYDKSLPKHQFLSREETLQLEPGLAQEGLQGAASYYDAQCAFVERLCLDNMTDAVEHGAQAYNYTTVTGLHREGNHVEGLNLRGTLTGETAAVRADQIVNASGPWLDGLTGNLTGQNSRRLRLTKGVHIAAPPAVNHALVGHELGRHDRYGLQRRSGRGTGKR
jgi:glycerol-3-phosphate dehydrogenase